MNKKINGIFIMMLLLTTVFFSANVLSKNNTLDYKKNISLLPTGGGPIKDQENMAPAAGGTRVYRDGPLYAQEFVPSMTSLVQISLPFFPGPDGSPEPYFLNLSIRDELSEENIAISTAMAVEWPDMVEFTFDNVTLTPGESYFMILEALGGDLRDCYDWYYTRSSEDEYPFGQAWFYEAGGEWTVRENSEFEFFDYCFETYCWNNPPETTISGPTRGGYENKYTYNFTAIDAENHDIKLLEIDWGDGASEDVYGPYPSGQKVIKNHTWLEEGNYTIKARAVDYHGGRPFYGEWVTLEVTMPKSKSNHPLCFFLERFMQWFPFLQPLIKVITH